MAGLLQSRSRSKAKKSKANKSAGPRGTFARLPKNVRDILETERRENLETAEREAQLNRPDEIGPFGGRTMSVDPQTGRYTLTTTLTEPERRKYELETEGSLGRGEVVRDRLLPQLHSALSQPLDLSRLPQVRGADDYLRYQRQVADDVYRDFFAQNEAQWRKEDELFNQAMADRGIPFGSEEYERRYRQIMRGREEAMRAAQTQARALGADLARQSYEQDLASRQQAIEEQLLARRAPIDEISRLEALQRPVYSQQYTPFTPVNIPDVDVSGVTMGQRRLDAEKELARLQAQAAERAARIAGEYSIRRQELENQGARDRTQAAIDSQPEPPSPWQGVVTGIGQGIGAGIGSGFGSWIGGVLKRRRGLL